MNHHPHHAQATDADPVTTRLRNAQAALERGETDRALDAFRDVLGQRPSSVDAYVGRGACLAMLNEPDRARADFERACALAPDRADGWYHLGRLAQSLGDVEGAVREFLRAIEVRPEARTFFALGQIHVDLGEDFEAIDAFGRAFELDHRSVAALSERARIFMAHECHVAALADYATCVLLEPDKAQHRVNRGNAHYELGDHEHAIVDYEAALSLDRCLPEVSLNLGCIALDSDRILQAIQHFNDAIAMNPEYARAHLNRGLAHFYRGYDEGAEDDLVQAATLDPEDPDALFALGRLYARQHRYGPASERLSDALEKCPDYVDELLQDDVFDELRKLRDVKRMIASARERLA